MCAAGLDPRRWTPEILGILDRPLKCTDLHRDQERPAGLELPRPDQIALVCTHAAPGVRWVVDAREWGVGERGSGVGGREGEREGGARTCIVK